MTKVSKIFEENKLIDSKSFNSLSPVMKEAVKDMFKLINNKGNIILNVENAVEKVSKFHNVNKDDIEEYFDDELKEQIEE